MRRYSRRVFAFAPVLVSLASVSGPVHAATAPGDLIWAKQAGGSGADIGGGVAVLSDGSVVLAGCFSGTATFNPGEPGETNLTSAGVYDCCLARYNPDGILAWAKRAGGSGYDVGYEVAVLSDDSTFVVGYFDGTATFGPGEPGATVLTSVGGPAVFLARYNPDGTLAWAKGADATGLAYGLAVSALSDGTALVTGCFQGTATFGAGEPGETSLTCAGLQDMFLAHYNSDGTLIWAKHAGGSDCADGRDVAVLPDGFALVTGWFSGTATFGAGEPGATSLVSAGSNEIFLARYNADGTLNWAKRAGGSEYDVGYGVAVLSDGSPLLTGHFSGAATFGPGEPGEMILTSAGLEDVFVANYNPDGTLAWAKRAGGTGEDHAYSVAVSVGGSALVAGRFDGTATFGPGETSETSLISAGGNDIFLARYSAGGTLDWAKRGGGVDDDWGESVAVVPDGSAFLTGRFRSTATFGPGEPGETSLTSAGSDDIFIARYATAAGQPPVADAGGDMWYTDWDYDGWEWVGLDGSMSYDTDGWIMTWDWYEDGTSYLGSGEWPSFNLSLGTHWIELRVTDNDGLTGTDWVTVEVRTPVTPDLEARGSQVTSGGVPTAREGTDIWFTLTSDFAEIAGGDIASMFDVSAYLSEWDNSIDRFSDTFLGSVSTSLWPRGESRVDIDVWIPGTYSAGTYYVGCYVDSNDMIAESNEGNNADSNGLVVRVDILPQALSPSEVDLTVENAQVALQTDVVLDAGFDCYVEARSLGAEPPSSFRVGVYFSTDGVIDATDYLVGYLDGVTAGDLQDWIVVPCLADSAIGISTGMSYTWGVIVDDQDVVVEVNESNNTYQSWQVAVVDDIPANRQVDLEAEDGHGPPILTMEVNAPYSVTYSVRVNGNCDSGLFVIRYYISYDQVIDPVVDTPIGEVNVPGLPVGYGYWAEPNWVTVTVPAGTPPGQYYLGFIVDADETVVETDETNNDSASSYTVTVVAAGAGRPDLVVALIEPDRGPGGVSPVYYVESGGAVTIPVMTVANFGTQGVPAGVQVDFYLSGDQNVSIGSDTLVGGCTCGALDAGKYEAVPDPATLDLSAFGPGTYYLYAYIDPLNAVSETDETNNDSATLVVGPDEIGSWIEIVISDATLDRPELVAGLDIDSDDYEVQPWGTHIWCGVTVANACLSAGTDAGASAVTIWISTDPSPWVQPGDVYLGTEAVGFLAPGGSYRFDFNDQLPFTPDEETDYYFKAVADALYEVDEMDESNNTAVSRSFQFRITFSDIGAGLTGVSGCSVAWGDYDNDGDLDLAVAGSGWSAIYRNDGGSFADIGAALAGVTQCSLAWGDYDNDGDLDLALAGDTGGSYVSIIYNYDGVTFNDIGAPLMGVSDCSLAWGDYDNDGDLDLVLAGDTGGGLAVTEIYQNDGASFSGIGGLDGVRDHPSLAWGDYDGDGDLDLALAGFSGTASISRIYRNDGWGIFIDIGAGLTGVEWCSLAWGDYDNDGDLDLALAGAVDTSGGIYVSKIYRNNGGTFTDIGAGLTGVERCSLAWGDYDNDGDLDLALAGHDGAGGVAMIYRNDAGAFTDVDAGLTGVGICSLAWGDYDSDGDLDLAVAGYDGASNITRIYRNDGAPRNQEPWSVWGLGAVAAAGDVTFRWGGGSDNETPWEGLSYNLRVGTASGQGDIFSGMADQSQGKRRIPALGNAQQNYSWTLRNLPNGTYYFNVQCIDSAFAGSQWSQERQVAVGPAPDLDIISLSASASDPNVTDTIDVYVTVRNSGDVDAGAFDVALFYDRGEWHQPFPSDWEDEKRSVAALASGAETTVTFTGVSHTYGSVWYMYAVADNSIRVAESDETDNGAGPVTVTWHGPDLVIDRIKISDSEPFTDEYIYVDVTIRNQGDRDAGQFSVGLFYNPPSQPSPGEIADETVTVPSLPAGGELTVRFAGLGSAAVEHWNTAAVADNSGWPGDVTEIEEWNNVQTTAIDWRKPFKFKVSPESASFQARAGSEGVLTKTVIVTHKNPVGSALEISVTADLPYYVEVTPAQFQLPPGGSQTVYVQVDPSLIDPAKSMSLRSVGRVTVRDPGGDEIEIDVRVGIEPSVTGFDFAFGCGPESGSRGGDAGVLTLILALCALVACLALCRRGVRSDEERIV